MPMPRTEAPGRLQAQLLARGARMPRQRRPILGVIETADQHLDVGMILRKARKADPTIDRVTVYRTIKLLKRHGLADEVDLLHLRGHTHHYPRHTLAPSGAVISGARVNLFRQGQTAVATVGTNEFGEFHLTQVAAGSYELVAQAPGMEAQRRAGNGA